MQSYDEELLIRRLTALSPTRRSVFALACASRLINFMNGLPGDAELVFPAKANGMAQQLWSGITNPSTAVHKDDLALWYEEILELLPTEDNSWIELDIYLSDALSALAYAIACTKSGEAQEAAWAARLLYEAADQRAIILLGLEPGDAGYEEKALGHVDVQTELARQSRDMDLLFAAQESEVYLFALNEQALQH